MTGKNRLLKPGQILFQVGEGSDGMYLIRKGQILVYLDKGGTEIPLATLKTGAMLGEMALFDQKPRSASARALDETEVTLITSEEFQKILTQIPKWFVTLMTTLTARLRDTNERLQEVEGTYKGNLNPIEEMIKVLHVLQLLYYKSGVKEVKSWGLEREPAEIELSMILNKERDKVTPVVQAVISGGLLTITKNSYKKEMLTVLNRGDLDRFLEFAAKIRQKDANLKYLPQDYVDIVDLLSQEAKSGAYDTFSMELRGLLDAGRKKGFKVEKWAGCVPLLVGVHDSVSVGKGAKDIVIKVQKKLVGQLLQHAQILRAISRTEEGRKKAG